MDYTVEEVRACHARIIARLRDGLPPAKMDLRLIVQWTQGLIDAGKPPPAEVLGALQRTQKLLASLEKKDQTQ